MISMVQSKEEIAARVKIYADKPENKARAKARAKEYAARPENKARAKARAKVLNAKPENVARRKAYAAKPENKAKAAARAARPENRTRERARAARPENRAKQKEYDARPDVKARQKARGIKYRSKPEVRASQNAKAKAYAADPENKVKIAARAKKHRDKPEVRAKARVREKEHRAKPEVKARMKALRTVWAASYHGVIVSCMGCARAKCRSEGWDYPDFDAEWVMDQIIANEYKCHESGTPFDLVSKTKRTRSDKPSLQRKDPNKGYTKDNVIVTTWFWNRSVRDGVDGDFHRHVQNKIKKDRAEQKAKRDAAKRNTDQLTMDWAGVS